MSQKQVELDPRPAYHAVSVSSDGVSTHSSHDGQQWVSVRHHKLPREDCYDIVMSPDGAYRLLAYSHVDKHGGRLLNVLRGATANAWSKKASALPIPTTVSCGQPQMRYLRDNLYGIMWLDEGSLYSAIYDAAEPDGRNLYLNAPVQNEWFDLARITDLSFAYHAGGVFVVWSPNSKDRIMTMRGELIDHSIKFGEADYHPEDHVSVSNMIFDGDDMYIAVVTGKRVNTLLYSDDGSYWSKQATCYNTENYPILIPFLYKDAQGNKIYLKTYDYAGTVHALQNFTDCERTEVSLPPEVIRVEYFPGMQ